MDLPILAALGGFEEGGCMALDRELDGLAFGVGRGHGRVVGDDEAGVGRLKLPCGLGKEWRKESCENMRDQYEYHLESTAVVPKKLCRGGQQHISGLFGSKLQTKRGARRRMISSSHPSIILQFTVVVVVRA
jgi:hypothetical protein